MFATFIRKLDSTAKRVAPYRSVLRGSIVIFSLAAIAYHFVGDQWIAEPSIALWMLVVILSFLCWSLGLWALQDAFHPDHGWLRSKGKTVFYFPWFRAIFVVGILALLLTPFFVAVFVLTIERQAA